MRGSSDSDIDEVLYVPSFLDPRFKAEYIGSVATDLAMVKDRIVREGVELMPKDTAPEVPHSKPSKATEPPVKKRKLGSWLNEAKGTGLTGVSTPLSADQKVQKEIQRLSVGSCS